MSISADSVADWAAVGGAIVTLLSVTAALRFHVKRIPDRTEVTLTIRVKGKAVRVFHAGNSKDPAFKLTLEKKLREAERTGRDVQ